MIAEPLYDDSFPGEHWAHAALELKDGRRLVSAPCTARSHPERPVSDSELVDKFHEMAAPILGESTRETVVAGCFAVDQQNDLVSTVNLLISIY